MTEYQGFFFFFGSSLWKLKGPLVTFALQVLCIVVWWKIVGIPYQIYIWNMFNWVAYFSHRNKNDTVQFWANKHHEVFTVWKKKNEKIVIRKEIRKIKYLSYCLSLIKSYCARLWSLLKGNAVPFLILSLCWIPLLWLGLLILQFVPLITLYQGKVKDGTLKQHRWIWHTHKKKCLKWINPPKLITPLNPFWHIYICITQ